MAMTRKQDDCFGMGGGVVGKVVCYGWMTGWWLGGGYVRRGCCNMGDLSRR